MIIGSSSRLVAGRTAVQTVYWRATKNKTTGAGSEISPKIYKTGRTLTFDKNSNHTPPSNFALNNTNSRSFSTA
ncbi:uncharacterized protein LOC113471847 [Diaphorina citri]|uniref:Uncharacterized protein LOC113471847 n=1 Tax=Diaphorina citri TaxID=121845 RepID=A0A3Q0JJV2_DIACI|nr:uncharacterized protein LOC113471847 [Diaphorina citri]